MSIQKKEKSEFKHIRWGRVPAEWNYGKLSQILIDKDCIKTGPFGSSLIKEYYVASGYKVYGQEHVIADSLQVGDYYINIERFEKLKQFEIKAGDILISLVGTLGKVLLVEDDFQRGIINPRLLRIRISSSKCFPKFFQYLFKSPMIQNQLYKMSTGGTMDIINASIIKSLYLIIPTYPEQIKIAAILSTWDEAITKTKQIIFEFQQRNKGLMQRLLNSKTNWKEYKIGNLLKEIKRPVKWDDDELYSLISVRRRSGGAFFRERLYGNQILTKQLYRAERGDFLISKMQIVHGASAMVPAELEGMKVSGSYIIARAEDDDILDISFFNWLSKTPWFYKLAYISSYGVHIEKMTFDFEDFKRKKLSLPSIKEQVQIVNTLTTADEEIKLYQQRLAALQQQKNGLMQNLLTGKVRVKI